MTKQILDIRDEIVKMLFTDGQKREASRLVLEYRQDNDRVMMEGTGWSKDAIKDKIAEILVGQFEPPVKPNFADGLQEGIDYCQTQIDRLKEIYKDDPMYGLNAIQKYIDVRDHLKSKISV